MFLIQREKVKLLSGENFPEPKKEGVREREARGRESERERERGGGWKVKIYFVQWNEKCFILETKINGQIFQLSVKSFFY